MIDSLRECVRQMLPEKFVTRDNAGLAFTRLIPKAFESSDHKDRGEVIDALANANTDYPAYQAALKGYRELIRQGALGACTTFELKTATRLIIGFGERGGLDFGITLHHTYGVPVLPGSALKGSASSFAHATGGPDWAKTPGNKGKFAADLFGGRHQPARGREIVASGLVDFLDAWWVPDGYATPFTRDVITPHHNSYFSKDGWPDGMDDPVPVSIIVLRPGLTFLFTVRGPDKTREVAAGILRDALCHRRDPDNNDRTLPGQNLGGKKTIGYGRFEPINQAGA